MANARPSERQEERAVPERTGKLISFNLAGDQRPPTSFTDVRARVRASYWFSRISAWRVYPDNRDRKTNIATIFRNRDPSRSLRESFRSSTEITLRWRCGEHVIYLFIQYAKETISLSSSRTQSKVTECAGGLLTLRISSMTCALSGT